MRNKISALGVKLPPKNLYSRLTLITTVTLIFGYFMVYAVYTNFVPEEYESGAQLSSTFLGKIVSNLDEINGRVSNFSFSAGNVGIGTASPGAILEVTRPAGAPTVSALIARGTATTKWGAEIIHADGPYANIAGGTYAGVFMNGNVGIGTVAPEHKLQVSGTNYIINAYNSSTATPDSARISLRTGLTGSATAGFEFDIMNDSAYTAGQRAVIQAYRYNGGWVPLDIGIIGGNVGIGAMPPNGSTYKLYVSWNTYTTWTYWSSDKRWKKHISTFSWALEKIEKLRWVTFDWRRDEYKNMNFDTGSQIWFIAQEVEKILPELVKTDTNWYKAVSYDKFSAILLEAIKEQQKQIEKLEGKIERLESK